MGYFSNQTSIEARISSLRLLGFIDRNADSIPDPAALSSGILAAYGTITGYIGREYDSDTIDAWDIDDSENLPPALIRTISDDLCIQIYFKGNPKYQAIASDMYREAVSQLEKIRDRKLDIYGVTRNEIESSTTRMTYLDCTDSEANAGLCDPCAYEYI